MVLDLTASGKYDVITAVAVLHHVPPADALPKLVAALAPGGTLFVVGCYREDRITDRALSRAAVPANIAVALVKSRGRRIDRPVSMNASTASPTDPLATIHALAGDLLPGYRLRRGLFWRYLLHYTAPR